MVAAQQHRQGSTQSWLRAITENFESERPKVNVDVRSYRFCSPHSSPTRPYVGYDGSTVATMSSLRYGTRCLRALPTSTTKQWPSLAKAAQSKNAAPRRTLATTAPRRQLDNGPDNGLEDALGSLEMGGDEVITTFARPMPVSPSYYTRLPQFNDSFVQIQDLAQKYARLPSLHHSQVERVAWKTKEQYRVSIGEHVKARDYATCIALVKRLSQIHPDLMPEEVTEGLQPFKRDINNYLNRPKATVVDRFGRSHGVGRRKSSVARAWLVEGTGEVLINGKPISEAFGRVHDRESAVWGLKATDRLDKYNVWALVSGGGSTGQAEALAMAVAKALVVHEPPLKTPLRRAGCITRDPRSVERKKAGHVKARKSPAWVKR
ncbi:putative 40S ribosomal protein S9 [Rosellinia necatrix]|uniref:Small ribosomal subunit protein uS9m n=1 Tax=Rosellinia necatrix TaxID=77044 RepID=A0A1W2THN6_ROSNE|nr:putative 40S ribosomal protein S9 [Rosellinia necatrix]